jgi:dihydrofolate reductase
VGKVVLSEFVTLDDVMEDPGGGEGLERGGWQIPFVDDDLNAYAREVLFESDALLLGRVTFETFAQAWPSITDEEGFADTMNTMPKFVVSRTLTEPLDWNATLIKGDVVEEVNRLKQDRTLLMYGSGELAGALMRSGLIDDFRIWIHPIALGAGRRLFPDGMAVEGLRLKEARTTGSGVVILSLDAPK